MECVILKNAINQIDDFFNAASRKKTRWEKKNWSFNFFTIFFLQSIDHIGKKDHTTKNVHTFKKSPNGFTFEFYPPHPIIGDKTPNFFVVGTNAFTCCPFMATSFLENGFCRHSCCSCMADFLAFWLHTHMNSEYGFQWRENHKQ